MPTYVYKFVKTGETIEVEQSFSDDALTTAVNPRTGRRMAVKKVFTPVGVTFRGDGFYKTDSRSSRSASAKNGSDSSSSDSSSSDSSSSTERSPAGDTGPSADKSAGKNATTAKPDSATASKPAATAS